MKYKEQQELVNDLRELADFYERPQSIELPSVNAGQHFYVTVYDWLSGRYEPNPVKTKAKMKRIVLALGSCEKEWYDHALHVVKKIGTVKLVFEVSRGAVCEKKLTGNKIIHA